MKGNIKLKRELSIDEIKSLHVLLSQVSNGIFPAHKSYLHFYNYIKQMRNNIDICKKENYQFRKELTICLQEDWKSIFTEQKNIQTFHISCNDIDEQYRKNIEIQNDIKEIDKILEANNSTVSELFSRKWYSTRELEKIGRTFIEQEEIWNLQINEIKHKYGMCKSPISIINDEIWTYAKFLCICAEEEELLKWFHEEVPAYRYLIPINVLKLLNGDMILKDFMLNMHTLM